MSIFTTGFLDLSGLFEQEIKPIKKKVNSNERRILNFIFGHVYFELIKINKL
jgi:hypothetical protein